MTVKELIERLQSVKDQEKLVLVNGSNIYRTITKFSAYLDEDFITLTRETLDEAEKREFSTNDEYPDDDEMDEAEAIRLEEEALKDLE